MTIETLLSDLLHRWETRGQQLRQEIAFQREMIAPTALTAHGNRLAASERRRRELRRMSDVAAESQQRWTERLQRIEAWNSSTESIAQEKAALSRLISGSLWLKKARSHQDAFVRRLEQRAEAVSTEQQGLHERLLGWLSALNERERALEDLGEKRERSEKPFYISRGRKLPEVQFLEQQNEMGRQLGAELQRLRGTLRKAIERLARAIHTVETQASGPHILYEVHKHEIVSALSETGMSLKSRRDSLLSDALIYEEGCYRLRQLQQTVSSYACLEDISRERKGGWKSYFSKT